MFYWNPVQDRYFSGSGKVRFLNQHLFWMSVAEKLSVYLQVSSVLFFWWKFIKLKEKGTCPLINFCSHSTNRLLKS